MSPIFYQLPFEERIQTIRVRMAHEFGCAPEELALTRNASESLQISTERLRSLAAGDDGCDHRAGLSPDAHSLLGTNEGGATVSRWFGFNSPSRQQRMISFPASNVRSRRERRSCISLTQLT